MFSAVGVDPGDEIIIGSIRRQILVRVKWHDRGKFAGMAGLT